MVVVVLAAMAGLGGVLFSQTGDSPENNESVYTLSVFQDLVLVDVVVTDKNGHPIPNLKREELHCIRRQSSPESQHFRL